MRIDWWTLALQTINVLVLVWILSRFLFKPVVAIVQARRAEAEEILDAARAVKAEAETAKAGAEAEVERQLRDRDAALAKVAKDAEAEKTALLAAARDEATRLRAAAEAEIAGLEKGAATIAADRASRLAIDIAAKLLGRLPQDIRISGFVDGLLEAVAALPEATRASLAADGAPLRLMAPRALTDDESQSLRAGLARVLGREVALTVVLEPDLVAGLELEAPHASVRNSFRNDLASLAGELTRP